MTWGSRFLRSWGLAHSEAAVSAKWIAQKGRRGEIKKMLTRRGKDREPLAYILGSTDFFGMRNFQCRAPVLIPRPETEQLIDLILSRTLTHPKLFVDVCCGSGAIAIALLRQWPESRAIALDASIVAVELTKLNARLFGVEDRLEIIHAKVEDYVPPARIDLVVSNPPYIPTGRIAELQPEIVKWEDPAALDG